MSIEDPREYARQCKIEEYEHLKNRECQSIGRVLELNDIKSCWDDQYNIVIMYNKYGVELSDLDLELYSNVDEVIEALDSIR